MLRSEILKSLGFSLLIALQAQAAPVFDNPNAYYGQDFYNELAQGNLKNQILKDKLNAILKKVHIGHPDDYDEISESCPSKAKCTQFKKFSYNEARQFLFGQLHLEASPKGGYQLRTIYCEETLDSSSFGRKGGPGPGRIPDSTLVNTEHAWPQSKFNRAEPINTQKTDLHILYPVLTYVNTIRGNRPYGEVQDPLPSPCPDVKVGRISEDSSNIYFEPAAKERGNLARSLFYFSVRYKNAIDKIQEAYLRKWNHEDPVSEEEKERNDKIYDFQGTRNPFVDHPDLSDLISDF